MAMVDLSGFFMQTVILEARDNPCMARWSPIRLVSDKTLITSDCPGIIGCLGQVGTVHPQDDLTLERGQGFFTIIGKFKLTISHRHVVGWFHNLNSFFKWE